MRREERRQSRQRGIDQHRNSPLGDRADLANRQRDHVGGESHWFGMEVATRQGLVGVGKDQRVVGDAVGLDFKRRGGLTQEVEHRAHHLRLAAQAIGILHTAVVIEVAGADATAGHQRAERIGDFDLAAMAAQCVDARIERRVGALGSLGRQRAGHDGGAEQQFCFEQSRKRVRGGELGAVEQRESFLGAEFERIESRARKRLARRQPVAFEIDLAHPDHRRRQMRQRG